MLVDWFTVTAQVVNFLILVALLRYFLFGPLVAAMDRREASVASRWEEAARQRQEAENEAAELRRRKQELEDVREEALAESRRAAKELRRELVRKARADTDRLREEWREELKRRQRSFLDELRRRTVKGACSVARKVLADLADAELEQRILTTFVRRLDSFEIEDRESISGEGAPPAIVRSAFPVPGDLRAGIEAALGRHLPPDARISFKTAPDLLCGVEVILGSHKISWEIADYLEALEEEVLGTLEGET